MNLWNLAAQAFNVQGMQAMSFEASYRCYSVAMKGKENLENGGKILLPPSALDMLARLNIEYPMLFELTGAQGRVTHCGVLEFTAEEGVCYLPHWMMQQLLVSEDNIVRVKSATLSKGVYCKLQPVDEAFLELTNPKAVLENALRNWSALTIGDVIVIKYNNKNYEINVLEVKPKTASHAISIIEADVVVDFAPSQEQLKKAEQARRQQLEKAAMHAIKGKDKEVEVDPNPQEPVVKFPGSGFRLDGRRAPASTATSTTSPSTKPLKSPTVPASSSSSSSSASTPAAQPVQRMPGGLVFGSSSGNPQASAPASSKEPNKKEEEKTASQPKFVPFSGRGYSLRG